MNPFIKNKSFFLPIIFVCIFNQIAAQNGKLFVVITPTNQSKGGIAEVDPKSGQIIKMLGFATDLIYEDGLTFDGTFIYYINGRLPSDSLATKEYGILPGFGNNKIIRITGGLTAVVDTLSIVLPPRIDGLGFGGKAIWVLDYRQNKIYKINRRGNKILATISPNFTAVGGISYSTKRQSIFVSSFDININVDPPIPIPGGKPKIFEISPSNGKVINSFEVSILPTGVSYSSSLDILFISTGSAINKGDLTYALHPTTGKILYTFKGSYPAIASDE